MVLEKSKAANDNTFNLVNYLKTEQMENKATKIGQLVSGGLKREEEKSSDVFT